MNGDYLPTRVIKVITLVRLSCIILQVCVIGVKLLKPLRHHLHAHNDTCVGRGVITNGITVLSYSDPNLNTQSENCFNPGAL